MRKPAPIQPTLPRPPDFDALERAATRRPSNDRVAFMNLIGDLNLAWSNTESMFIYVLMLLIGSDEKAAAIIFATLNTTRARLDLVQRLAKVALADRALRAELTEILDRFSAVTRLRNDLSHATFVIDTDGNITHTQNMKVEESRGQLRFGVRRPVDPPRLHAIAAAIDDVNAVNRRLWDLVQALWTLRYGAAERG